MIHQHFGKVFAVDVCKLSRESIRAHNEHVVLIASASQDGKSDHRYAEVYGCSLKFATFAVERETKDKKPKRCQP